MSNGKVSVSELREVETDKELETGIFYLGRYYHIRTPTYQYLGALVAISGTVFKFVDTATVHETGPYESFYGDLSPRDCQYHSNTRSLIVDRAGTVLHELSGRPNYVAADGQTKVPVPAHAAKALGLDVKELDLDVKEPDLDVKKLDLDALDLSTKTE